MTGRIKSLSELSASGFITAATGQNVYFHSSAVLPPGAGGLAVGQLVTFDMNIGKWPEALNVRGPAQPQPAAALADRHAVRTYLQYMGFEQTGMTRAYLFRRIARGEDTREFVVNADMGLFSRHHVGIQEGPTLSLRLLSEGSDSTTPAVMCPPAQSLSDADMVGYLARRALGKKPHGSRRNPSS